VADFLQTDDLFQLAKPHEVPALPDFNQLSPADPGTSSNEPASRTDAPVLLTEDPDGQAPASGSVGQVD
jgi:hypothetical protein